MWIVWMALLLGTASAISEVHHLDGFKAYTKCRVFTVNPKTLEDAKVLFQLEIEGYDFWTPIRGLNISVDIMVTPAQNNHFIALMEDNKMEYNVSISDLTALIKEEKTRIIKNMRDTSGFNFNDYQRWDVIEQHLKTLASNYTQAQVISAGQSYEGRNITGIRISTKTGNRAILIDGGIHAREWIAPAVAMHILTQLLTSKDQIIRNLAENYDWHIFPSVNPDGYEYSHTNERFWRKNRQPQSENCIGLDLNRNWDIHFGELDSTKTSHNCSTEIFHGLTAFSGTEAAALSKFYTTLNGSLFAYFSLHSYSQLLLFPYGWTLDHLDNYNDTLKIGEKAAQEMGKRYGKTYKAESAAELYIASGLSTDWVKQNLKPPLVYTYELRETLGGNYGFQLPPDQIIPSGEEALDGIVATLLEAKNMGIQ